MIHEPVMMRFAGTELRAAIEDDGEGAISPHTGRTLRHVTLKTVVRGDDEHDRAEEHLVRDAKIQTTDGQDNGVTWVVAKRSYSLTHGRSGAASVMEYRYSVELDEHEDLNLTQLEIDDLIVVPYQFEEKAERGGIVIDARARLDAAQYARFMALYGSDNDYWPVVRRGISDEPRQMRMGWRLRWSKHDDVVKHDILLVERACDEQPDGAGFAMLFEPEMSYSRATLASTTELLDGLMDVLSNKGILTEPECRALREAAEQRTFARRREFFRVSDLDEIEP